MLVPSVLRAPVPVNHGYKGIPVFQAKRILDESITDSSRYFDGVLPLRHLTAKEPRCGLRNYNRPLMQRSMPRALMKDSRGGRVRTQGGRWPACTTRGAGLLARRGLQGPFVSRGRHHWRRLELNEHSPRRSNLDPSTQASRGGRNGFEGAFLR
ncbi:hypothetical protein RGE_38830 [Rubrivivax gelatinosus IL144]|uniref:Uncharacterized protein n=1 Tax=Rubrivivax gelatinosus (strain NBRC 100245 / IL144) TaxID=983917 RepID=I0HW32_RUBGI|nr:hypothetical protein RGE_38830 [Rubrivivax gelatinosus IL144]